LRHLGAWAFSYKNSPLGIFSTLYFFHKRTQSRLFEQARGTSVPEPKLALGHLSTLTRGHETEVPLQRVLALCPLHPQEKTEVPLQRVLALCPVISPFNPKDTKQDVRAAEALSVSLFTPGLVSASERPLPCAAPDVWRRSATVRLPRPFRWR